MGSGFEGFRVLVVEDVDVEEDVEVVLDEDVVDDVPAKERRDCIFLNKDIYSCEKDSSLCPAHFSSSASFGGAKPYSSLYVPMTLTKPFRQVPCWFGRRKAMALWAIRPLGYLDLPLIGF